MPCCLCFFFTMNERSSMNPLHDMLESHMQFYFIGRRAYYSYIICLALKNRNLRKWILRKWTGVVLLLFIFAYEFNHILLNKTSRINTTLVHFTAYMAVLPKSNYADFRNNERKSGTPLYCSYSCTKQINHRKQINYATTACKNKGNKVFCSGTCSSMRTRPESSSN
ncbi:hypothetical protein GmHk_06G015887 [Glycine max]|nr:hypothetical protein GmHk_06G015887 [Glycine max]